MRHRLPLIQRAKRAVIVGDPKQLRHLSFLANERQREYATNHGLSEEEARLFDYRHHSVLDLTSERIESQSSVNFLNEHFRSQPAIIGFSNRKFYSDRLNVMTEKPGTDASPALILHPCEGYRDNSGINRAEADAIVAAIASEIDQASHSPAGSAPSIGVLSPFRPQVDHLAARITETFNTDLTERHQVLVGTAHTFQGEERDLMFISFAIDADSPSASRRFLERPDIFNVAITRARQRQTVFSSIEAKRLPADSLLRHYLSFIGTANDTTEPASDDSLALLDRFAAELRQQLEGSGFQVWLGYPVAGLRIDLLALKDGRSLAIDLIGCPGPTAPVFPLERYKMFRRAGLTLWPLPYTNWIHDQAECLEAIEQAIKDVK